MRFHVNPKAVPVWIPLVILLSLALSFLRNSSPATRDRSWAKVHSGDLVEALVEVGEIQAIRSRFAQAPFEWRADLQIIDMVPEGIMVKQGDFLLRFDTGYLETELGAAQSQLQTNQAELKRLQAEQVSRMQQLNNDLKNARYAEELARLQIEKLKYESQVRQSNARLELEKALIALNEATAKISAQTTLDSLATEKVLISVAKEKARLQEVKNKMAELTLYAPNSGLVVYHEHRTMDGYEKYKIGDKVSPGQAVIEIPDLSQMQVVFTVHEMDRDKIQIVQKAVLTLEAFPDKMFQAKIREVARLAEALNEKSSVKKFSVKATIENNDAILKPGMTAKVRVILNEFHQVLSIPCTSVFEKEGKPVVFTSKSWPDPVFVTLGPRNDQAVIVKNGLQEKDKIAWQAPLEKAHQYRRLGYAAAVQRRQEKTERMTRELEEMSSRGLEFDYAQFRQTKGQGKQTSEKAPNSTPGAGSLKLPDGRAVALPPALLEKIKHSGGGKIVLQGKGAGQAAVANQQSKKKSKADSSATAKAGKP